MRLLITRPAGDAQAAAGDLTARGHAVLACPLIDVQKTGDVKPNLNAIQAFMVTDGDGARALADAVGVRTFPVFCDSAGTVAELNRLGFKDARSADGDATALARLIERSLTPKWGGLVYVCSTSAPVNLQAMLSNMGFAVRMTALYDVKRADALPTAIADALKNDALDAVVFFSADEARAFAQLVQRAELDTTTERLIAIVAAPVVAAPLTILKFAKVVSAPKSDALSVIEVVSDALLPQPEPIVDPEPDVIPEPNPEPVPDLDAAPAEVRRDPIVIEPAPPPPEEPETAAVASAPTPDVFAEMAASQMQESSSVEPEAAEITPALSVEQVPEPQTETVDKSAISAGVFAALGSLVAQWKTRTPEQTPAPVADAETVAAIEEAETVGKVEVESAPAPAFETEAEPVAAQEPEPIAVVSDVVLEELPARPLPGDFETIAVTPGPEPEPAHEVALEETKPPEVPAVRAGMFAGLSELVGRWTARKPAAAEAPTVEENEPASIPVVDDEVESQASFAEAPTPLPEAEAEPILIAEPLVVSGLETAPTPIAPELPEQETADEPDAEPEPAAAEDPVVVPEPVVVAGLETVPVVVAPEIEDLPSDNDAPPFVSESDQNPPPARETVFKKFATFMSRYRAKDETREIVAVEPPQVEATVAIETEVVSEQPTADVTPQPIAAPPPEPAPPEPSWIEPEPIVVAEAEPEVTAESTAAVESEPEPEPVTVDVAPEVTPAKPSLWAKARGVLGHLRAKKSVAVAPMGDEPVVEVGVATAQPENIADLAEEELAPPIPEILAAQDEAPVETMAAEIAEPVETTPEPVLVLEPAPTLDPEPMVEPEPPAPLPPPELEPPPGPIAVTVEEAPPESIPQPVPESPVFVTEKSPTEELTLGTMPPPTVPPEPDDSTESGGLKDGLILGTAAAWNQMDTSSDEIKSGGETLRSRTGGRSARLLAEDAADARALNQRFKFGGSESGESDAAPADSAPTSPQAQTRRRPSSRAVPLVVGAFVLAGVGYYTAEWWLPQVRSTGAVPTATETALVPNGSPAPNQLGDLQARADALATDLVALNKRMGAVEQRPAAAGDPAALADLTKRITALESAPTVDGTAPEGLSTSVTNQARQLASVTARVATLEAALGNVAKLEDLSTRLSSLEGKSAEANSVLALGERLASLEKRDAVAATALVLATAQLREATQSGRSYAVELETVAQLAARADVAFDSTALKVSAAKGLAQSAVLKASFPDAATKIVRAAALPENTTGWVRRVLDRVYAIVSVRPFGTLEGDSVEAIVARAEQALRNDNLAQAVTELGTLKGPALEAAQPWLSQATATVTAQNTIDELSARSVGAMSAISRIAPSAEPKAP